MTSAVARAARVSAVRPARWVMLMHQLPPAPAYLRVKVRRRLEKLGALLLKNSVYVLPNTAESVEDFHWLRREIVAAGGEATVNLADFVEGTSDMDLEDRARGASDAEYAAFVRSARRAGEAAGERELQRLRARLDDVRSRDFFNAPGRGRAERAMDEMLQARSTAANAHAEPAPDKPVGATWVTRRGVHVDRMASAWLIRRFIDPAARFRFVAAPEDVAPGDLRFDMFEGEYTHEGDRCTFQVLVARFALACPELDAIGAIVHDIDYKIVDSLREETGGVRALLRGICLARTTDEERLDAAGPVFDGLYAHFSPST